MSRFSLVIKEADIDIVPLIPESNNIRVFPRLAVVDTPIFVFTICASISIILKIITGTEIRSSIIKRIAVDMVDLRKTISHYHTVHMNCLSVAFQCCLNIVSGAFAPFVLFNNFYICLVTKSLSDYVSAFIVKIDSDNTIFDCVRIWVGTGYLSRRAKHFVAVVMLYAVSVFHMIHTSLTLAYRADVSSFLSHIFSFNCRHSRHFFHICSVTQNYTFLKELSHA